MDPHVSEEMQKRERNERFEVPQEADKQYVQYKHQHPSKGLTKSTYSPIFILADVGRRKRNYQQLFSSAAEVCPSAEAEPTNACLAANPKKLYKK